MPGMLPSREKPLKEPGGTIPGAIASDLIPFGSTLYQGATSGDRKQGAKDMASSMILGVLGSIVASPIAMKALKSAGGSQLVSKAKRLAKHPSKENVAKLKQLIANNPEARKALAQLGIFNVASAGISGTADETLNRYRNNEKLLSTKDNPLG